MERRGFLKLILAGASAPAIVKADRLMKIWVPSQEIITNAYLDNLSKNMLFTRQALAILERNLMFTASINREWENRFEFQTNLKIIRPRKYANLLR